MENIKLSLASCIANDSTIRHIQLKKVQAHVALIRKRLALKGTEVFPVLLRTCGGKELHFGFNQMDPESKQGIWDPAIPLRIIVAPVSFHKRVRIIGRLGHGTAPPGTKGIQSVELDLTWVRYGYIIEAYLSLQPSGRHKLDFKIVALLMDDAERIPAILRLIQRTFKVRTQEIQALFDERAVSVQQKPAPNVVVDAQRVWNEQKPYYWAQQPEPSLVFPYVYTPWQSPGPYSFSCKDVGCLATLTYGTGKVTTTGDAPRALLV